MLLQESFEPDAKLRVPGAGLVKKSSTVRSYWPLEGLVEENFYAFIRRLHAPKKAGLLRPTLPWLRRWNKNYRTSESKDEGRDGFVFSGYFQVWPSPGFFENEP